MNGWFTDSPATRQVAHKEWVKFFTFNLFPVPVQGVVGINKRTLQVQILSHLCEWMYVRGD